MQIYDEIWKKILIQQGVDECSEINHYGNDTQIQINLKSSRVGCTIFVKEAE